MFVPLAIAIEKEFHQFVEEYANFHLGGRFLKKTESESSAALTALSVLFAELFGKAIRMKIFILTSEIFLNNNMEKNMIEPEEGKVFIRDLDGNLFEARTITDAEFSEFIEEKKNLGKALVIYSFNGKRSKEYLPEIEKIFSQIANMGYSPEIPLQKYANLEVSGSLRLKETILFERYQAVFICEG